MIGQTLGSRYKILKHIGSGGMADVYKALDTITENFVAVKVLKNEHSDNEQFLKKFLREAQADAKLSHQNVVDVYDVGIEGGVYYIVMEYVDGSTLKEYITLKGKLSAQEAVTLMIPIVDGLAHAHARGIIHRDIKPQNILLTTSRSPKIADFGIAHAVNSTNTLSSTEDVLGSVQYISPEQARGSFLDERSDLYSLGIMMYEMLTGSVPYDAQSPVGIALMHVQNNVPSPKDKVKSIPLGVAQIVLNLTRRKPDDRYQSADELNEDLMILASNPNAQINATYRGPAEMYGLEMPAEEKTPIDKQKLFRTAVVAAVAFIAVSSIIVGLFKTRRVEVPGVVNMSLTQAEELLSGMELGYQVVSRENSSEIAKDSIISQSPLKGEKVKKGFVINLVVSNGPNIVTVPYILGKSEAEAAEELRKAGLVVGTVSSYNNDEFAEGLIYEQSPSSGVKVKEGSSVNLYVSLGKETMLMPKLTDMSLAQAKTALKAAGLTLGNVSYGASSYYVKGKVMSQSPAAFVQVEKGAVIDLVVSDGVEVTKTFSLKIKDYISSPEEVLVEIYLCDSEGENPKLAYANSHKISDTVVFKLTGSGTRVYIVYFDKTLCEDASGAASF